MHIPFTQSQHSIAQEELSVRDVPCNSSCSSNNFGDLYSRCSAAAAVSAEHQCEAKGVVNEATPAGGDGGPVVGSTFAFLRPHRATALGDYMTQKISKYGQVFTARLFGRESIVSADAELNRHVLNNETRLFESAWPPHVPRLIGKHSTVLSTGDAHKQKKSIILSFVSSARTQSSFIRSIERQAAALVASWKGRDVIYGADEARKFSFYVISKKGSPQFQLICPEQHTTRL
uniref:Uncharacterized protein n=1 Tax=Ananas comosus var. bracteatus TaxID=296719 RepID=A0A6V7PZF2_ANACO|nr:unnamed protein product [Ananas comosus var. bracteatus]